VKDPQFYSGGGTLDEEAIRAGYPNWQSYRHAMKVAADREALRDAARAQAKFMASRRKQQSGGSAACYVPVRER